MFLILCAHFFIAYIIKPELNTAKSGAIDVNQRFWLLNQISVDTI